MATSRDLTLSGGEFGKGELVMEVNNLLTINPLTLAWLSLCWRRPIIVCSMMNVKVASYLDLK